MTRAAQPDTPGQPSPDLERLLASAPTVIQHLAEHHHLDHRRADDVAADVRTTAWRNAHRVRAGQETRWLTTVATRVLGNHQRSQTRQEAVGARLAQGTTPPVVPIEHLQAKLELDDALEQLTLVDQHLITLVAHGYTTAEITTTLAISHDATRQRLARARRQLQRQLNSNIQE